MPIRYMIVDDAPFISEVIKGIMNSAGHICVAEVSEADQVIEQTKKFLPDLIILDLVMPQKNGLQLAKELKAQFAETRIIACSTLDDEATQKKLAEIGVTDFIAKPFQKKEFLEKVGQIFKTEKMI